MALKNHNPFNNISLGNHKGNDGANSNENIKNPFGSNAGLIKGGDTANEKTDSKDDKNKNKRSNMDLSKLKDLNNSKPILLKNQNKKDAEKEKKIITTQSIGLLITFVLIILLSFILIGFGKYLIRNLVDNGSLKEFPTDEAWMDTDDYKDLTMIKVPTITEFAFFAEGIFSAARDNDAIQTTKAIAVATTFAASKLSKEKTGGGRGTPPCDCNEERRNRKDVKVKSPLFFYWMWSGISFSLLVFHNIIKLLAKCLKWVYSFTGGKDEKGGNNDQEGGGKSKFWLVVLTFFTKLGQDLFFAIFLIFFIFIFPIIGIIYALIASWELLFTLYIFNYWNKENQGSIDYQNDSKNYPKWPSFWRFCNLIRFLFWEGIILFVNLFFKSLSMFWGPILIFGKIILLIKMIWRIIKAILNNSAKKGTEENERVFINSAFRAGAAFFIIMSCIAFTKIFDYEHLAFIPATLSTITFISIILLNIFI